MRLEIILSFWHVFVFVKGMLRKREFTHKNEVDKVIILE